MSNNAEAFVKECFKNLQEKRLKRDHRVASQRLIAQMNKTLCEDENMQVVWTEGCVSASTARGNDYVWGLLMTDAVPIDCMRGVTDKLEYLSTIVTERMVS